VPPRGGTGKTLRPKWARQGPGTGLATGARSVLETRRELGRRLTVAWRTSIESTRRRILGSRVQASESGSRSATAMAGRPEMCVVGLAPCACRRE
jgi:hypothetical protein